MRQWAICPVVLILTDMPTQFSCSRRVLVCQNTACRKHQSSQVLAAFQANPVEGVEVIGSRCLGECGNGPMVLVLPEEVWYGKVHPDEVPAVVERHLRQQQPIKAMFYSKFHRS